jgi:hypothetical protein
MEKVFRLCLTIAQWQRSFISKNPKITTAISLGNWSSKNGIVLISS